MSDKLQVFLESGTGDAVAYWGSYIFWRKPASELPDETEDALDNVFAQALNQAISSS
jgi:hypothetical protein